MIETAPDPVKNLTSNNTEWKIEVTPTSKSKIGDVDFSNMALGKTFTDHFFICDYQEGVWREPRIQPLDKIELHPGAMALHYGQAVFEGLKATVQSKTGEPLLFRPQENARRLNCSASRMCMPTVPEDLFVSALKTLVNQEKRWIPTQEGSTLYVRPFIFADEPFLGMRPANTYKFMIIASPAGPYYDRRIKLYAEPRYVRAADGGTGEAKAAGNYAGAFLPTEKAKSQGFDQVLWLDAIDHKYIQEVGTMNIFFKVDGKVLTPKLDGSVLGGITRDSIIMILKDLGIEIVERPISIDEIIRCYEQNTLEEAFGSGTAVSIAKIENIANDNFSVDLPRENPLADEVLHILNGIKTQRIEDRFDWVVPVC